jgi:exosortase/archaeosortase family protein
MRLTSSTIRLFLTGRWNFVFEIFLFMFITYGFHGLYRLNSEYINSWFVLQRANQFLISMAYQQTLWIYNHVMVIEHLIEPSNIIRFKNLEAIQINNGCSGTKQMLQVIVLFVLYPGPWIRKVWYIPTVLGAIYLVNLFRISVLGFWRGQGWPYWDFLHDWPMRVMFYLVIFLFWYAWNEKIRKPSFSFKF